MPLISDLVAVPEQVHRGDFVLRLSQGVNDATGTLGDYVFTEQIVACFDSALTFVRAAVEGHTSKAAYLHGSFGSGKSHFMAVLHLLLQHNPEVRARAELEQVVSKHSRWLDGKKFLLVPYHLIGARSMESAILGHYVEHVRALHPDAPLPGVFLSERLFDDARRLRQTMGDETFFRSLESGRPASASGWGALGARWTPATFDAAIAAPPRDEARVRLVSDLVTTLFQSYRDVAASADKEAYVALDVGLSIISKHARALGYDALILFLDELILWLASRVADLGFVSREGQKLAKLVEAQTADRPTPVVSFVARQRDLRELVGEHVPGAERLGFADVLKYWEDRFHKITLEDRNLPVIVNKRVLKMRTLGARAELDAAFESATRVRDEVMSVLLTTEADRTMFKLVYPFSPALIQALVAVSSALQRERTALKILLQLLVNRRDDLQLGDIVPVGDLWDVIADGDEPFSEVMRIQFDNARRLYVQKLLPMLEQQHKGRADELRARPRGDVGGDAFRADDRLVKTLLLAALVPNVEAFKGLTAARLAALNHGSIRSPIPGREGRDVLMKCRAWVGGGIGEIKISEDATNPTIQIQLSGVDTESIFKNAESHDNEGNRRQLVRKLLFAQLGINDEDQLFHSYEWTWRGTRRRVQVVYANVWTLPDDSLRAREGDWRVVIDYPFDEEGYTPKDDIARIERFRAEGDPTRTLCWLPHFFSRDMRRDLGRLVVFEYILAGERFGDYASHLSAVDRSVARSLLDNQRSQLRQRVISALEVAYGVTNDTSGLIDGSHDLETSFQSLDPEFRPRPPTGAILGDAFKNLLDQMLSYQFRDHPKFEEEVRPAQVKKVLAEVRRAIAEPGGRIVVEKDLRPVMRAIANPLQLGEMTAGDAFLLGRHWYDHFKKSAAAAGSEITVARLRAWMDQPHPMGLPTQLQNLVILLFADQDQRSFFLHGGPTTPSLDSLSDELELRTQHLPDVKVWAVACQRASSIFGLTPSALVSATNVAQLEADLRGQAAGLRANADALRLKLAERGRDLGLTEGTPARLATAIAAQAVVEAILSATAGTVVEKFASGSGQPSPEILGSSLKKAGEVVEALDKTRWNVIESAWSLDTGADLRTQVVSVLSNDELHQALVPALQQIENDAARLLAESARRPPKPKAQPDEPVIPPVPRPPIGTKGTRVRLVEEQQSAQLDAVAAKQLFRELERKVDANTTRRLSISWRIEERDEG
jgi:hypothetical protein